MGKRTVFWCGLVALVGTWISVMVTPLRAETSTDHPSMPVHVEAALVAQDWMQVAQDLREIDEKNPNAILRLIKGHACLACGRSNQALGIFLGDFTPQDLHAWARWTGELVERNPGNSVAHYLAGDAAARQERWDEAIYSLSTALVFQPGSALILNARGVAYTAKADWDSARRDFNIILQAPDPPAYAYVSRGTYILQRQTDPGKALEYFDKAVCKSTECVLALNGRGCARMLLEEWEEAEVDLEKAAKLTQKGTLTKFHPLVALNLARLAEERNRATEEFLAHLAGIKPGTSLNEKFRIFKSLTPEKQQRALDVLTNARNWNQKWGGSSLLPSKITGGLGGGVKGSMIGPVPFFEGKLGAEWDFKQTSKFNFSHQDALLGKISHAFPKLKANKIGNFSAWKDQQFGGYGIFTKPGGISSSEIQLEPTDEGAWNVAAVYNLTYRVECASPEHDVGEGTREKAILHTKKEESHVEIR